MSKSNTQKNSLILSYRLSITPDVIIRCIIFIRRECEISYLHISARIPPSNIFYIGNGGGSSRRFKNIAFAKNDSLLWLISYSLKMIPSCDVRWIAWPFINWTLNWTTIEIWSESNIFNAIRIPDPSAWMKNPFGPPFLTSQTVKPRRWW